MMRGTPWAPPASGGAHLLPPHSNAMRSHASARLAARQRAEGTGRHGVFSSWGSHTSTTHTRPLAVW